MLIGTDLRLYYHPTSFVDYVATAADIMAKPDLVLNSVIYKPIAILNDGNLISGSLDHKIGKHPVKSFVMHIADKYDNIADIKSVEHHRADLEKLISISQQYPLHTYILFGIEYVVKYANSVIKTPIEVKVGKGWKNGSDHFVIVEKNDDSHLVISTNTVYNGVYLPDELAKLPGYPHRSSKILKWCKVHKH